MTSYTDTEPPPVGSRSAEDGRCLIGGHFYKSVRRVLKQLAADEETSMAALMSEGFAYILEKRGRPVPKELLQDLKDFEERGRRKNRTRKSTLVKAGL